MSARRGMVVQNMNRREFIGSTATLFQPVKQPNLLLIMTDQQSYSAWSGAGNPWLKTPAMDSIARAGFSLTSAHCTYPVCSPSRSSVFTSRYAHETQVMENGKAIAAGIPGMGEIFRDAGYRTVYGGKWHLPKSFDGMTGFEKLIGGAALGAKMDAPLADVCSKWISEYRGEPFLMVASFMNPHDICSWIRQHAGSRPDPGSAAWPPAPQNMGVDPSEPECIQYHRAAGYDLMSQAVKIASEWRAADVRRYLDGYYRLVEEVDRQVGRVLDALRASPHARDTLVCFVSDHGEGLGAHRWVQKAAFYEESVRVPLMFAGPGIPAGKRDAGLTSLLDILPTLCDYAGIPAPREARGRSLRPLFEGGAWERPFVAAELRYGSVEREGRMIRTPRYKYVRFNSGARPEQLFDLEFDPGETRNLVSESAAEGPLNEHRELLRDWQRETGDAVY